jgi:hypothetical protein
MIANVIFKTSSGGTTLSSIKQYYDSINVKKIQGLLVLTDGDFSDQNPALPVITGGNRMPIFLLISRKGQYDTIVKRLVNNSPANIIYTDIT